MKTMTLPDFLTNEEIDKALRLYRSAAPGTFAQRCCDEIIKPVMPRINKALGQENDAKYLAYAVEHVFSRLE
jgi:hypothetical protein